MIQAVRTKIAVVIPLLDEADTIGMVLADVITTMGNQYDLSITVVDDGSTDGSSQIIQEISKNDRRINCVRRNGRRGIGTATRLGVLLALKSGADAIVILDADGEHLVRTAKSLIISILEGYDLTLGSRYIRGGTTMKTWRELLLSRVFNIIFRLFSGCGVHDFTTGLRAFSPRLARLIVTESVHEGFSYQAEVTLLAHRHRYRIQEKPTTQRRRKRGASKFGLRRELPKHIRLLFSSVLARHYT